MSAESSVYEHRNIQLEEGVCDLQHKNVWVVVLVTDQDGLARSSHAGRVIVFFQSLQTRKD